MGCITISDKVELTTVASGYYGTETLNANFDEIESAFDNTLSLDGSTPNAMSAPFDVGLNRIINLGAAVDDTDAVRRVDIAGLIEEGILTVADELAEAVTEAAVDDVEAALAASLLVLGTETTEDLAEINAAGDAQVVAIQSAASAGVGTIDSAVTDGLAEISLASTATMYADTTAGLAATADQGYFLVAGDGTNTYAILYKDNAGTAVEVARFPSKAYLDAVIATIPDASPDTELIRDRHTSLSLLGVPAPTTGAAITDTTRVFSTPFSKRSYVYEIDVSGHTNLTVPGAFLQVKVLSRSGSNFTVVSERTLTIASGANVLTLGAGLTELIEIPAGHYLGIRAYSANGKINVISTGVPSTPYYSTAGNATGTFAVGTLTTNSAVQLAFKYRTQDGEVEATFDAQQAATGRTVYIGSETTPLNTGFSLSTADITWIPNVILESGTIEDWEIGLSTAGPFLGFLGRMQPNGTVTAYRVIPFTGVLGNNVYSTTTNTLPSDLTVYGGETIRGYLCTTSASSGKVAYLNESTLTERVGYGIASTPTTDLIGNHTLVRNTFQRLYQDRIKIKVPNHTGNVQARPRRVLQDINFKLGYDTFVDYKVTGGTFSAAGVTLGTLGISNGIRGNIAHALHKHKRTFWMNCGTANEVILGADAEGSTNYGTAVSIDIPENKIRIFQMNSNTNYTTNNLAGNIPATTITAPFNAAMTGLTNLKITLHRDWRNMHIIVENVDTHEVARIQDTGNDAYNDTINTYGTTYTRALNTWQDETDLGDIGQMGGRWFMSNIDGTGSILQRVREESDVLDAEWILVGDSMTHSRADKDDSLAGRLEAALLDSNQRFALNAVDGSSVVDTRKVMYRLASYMPYLRGMIYMQGMNDIFIPNAGGLTQAEAEAQIDMIFRRFDDLGYKASVVCDVFPYARGLATSTSGNAGNQALTTKLRAVSTAYKLDHVYFQVSASAAGNEGYRDDFKFNGPVDLHLSPTTGHPIFAKQITFEGSSLGVSITNVPGRFFNY